MKFYYSNINKIYILEYYNMTNKKFKPVINSDDKPKDKLNNKILRFDPHIEINEIDHSDLDELDLNNIDETDIIDEEEQGIINPELGFDSSKLPEEQEINDDEENFTENPYIKNIMDLFLSKYPHLDNYANKKIIIQLCEMLISHVPDYSHKPNYYVNILESAIKQISEPSFNDIIDNEIKV